jgi:hypothetical protein
MRAQELPVSVIILIIIAIIILVLAVFFIIIPISKAPVPTPSSTNVSGFEFTCSTACQLASSDIPSQTSFCTDTLSGTSYHCYDQYSNGQYFYDSGQCFYTASNGKQMVANSMTCK